MYLVVIKPLVIKTAKETREFIPDDVITIEDEKSYKLIETGKVRPIIEAMEQHLEKFINLDFNTDSSKRPAELNESIYEEGKALLKAYESGDFGLFMRSVKMLETLYRK